MSIRTASSPGKLILSGEHSVVHGAPALAMAVKQRATVTFEEKDTSEVILRFPGSEQVRTLSEIERIGLETAKRHQSFLRGECEIGEVAPKPEDLLFTAIAQAGLAHGGSIDCESDIPLGAGMGSSAAFLLALFKVLQPELTPKELYTSALRCEHYQHGTSSGIDVAASLYGGVLVSQRGIHTKERLASIPPFTLYDTGRPQSTTGECVARVGERFPDDDGIWTDFEFSTREALFALQSGDAKAWKDQIRDNHALLTAIGVVPDVVAGEIAQIEARNGAAKICGAGSVRGDAAGLVLVWGDDAVEVPKSWQKIDASLSASGTNDHSHDS